MKGCLQLKHHLSPHPPAAVWGITALFCSIAEQTGLLLVLKVGRCFLLSEGHCLLDISVLKQEASILVCFWSETTSYYAHHKAEPYPLAVVTESQAWDQPGDRFLFWAFSPRPPWGHRQFPLHLAALLIVGTLCQYKPSLVRAPYKHQCL